MALSPDAYCVPLRFIYTSYRRRRRIFVFIETFFANNLVIRVKDAFYYCVTFVHLPDYYISYLQFHLVLFDLTLQMLLMGQKDFFKEKSEWT